MTGDEFEITDRGAAIIEAGLTLRQAHEIKTGCTEKDLCDRCQRDIQVSQDVLDFYAVVRETQQAREGEQP